MKYDYLFKILLIGDSGVGKTSIMTRCAENDFNEHTISTLGIDFKLKEIQLLNGSVAKLQIWDTAGQERYRSSLTNSYYRGAQAIIIVFDVSDMSSFENISAWYEEVLKFDDKNVIVLVGNKIDLERQVPTEKAKKFAEKHGIFYIETSAKDDINVNYLFHYVSEEVYTKKIINNDSKMSDNKEKGIKLGVKNKTLTEDCC